MFELEANLGTITKMSGLSTRGEPYRVMLVLAPHGTISTSLIHAMEHEFPWVVVEQSEHVSAACAACSHPVSLILVDATLLEAAEAVAPEILRQHSQAIVALIDKAGYEPAAASSRLPGSPVIRSVLPMNVSLDIWLSILRLMLCGGEYFPPSMIQAPAKSEAGQFPAGLSSREEALDQLTAREVQILEMVARGLQNKSIAAAFSLSESTVKVHLHNIISKLGVHNRTEAAAKLRDNRSPNLHRKTNNVR